MKKNKKPRKAVTSFDAVKMMRDIKEYLSVKYWKHPDVLKKEMELIRKKYKTRPHKLKSAQSGNCLKTSEVSKKTSEVSYC